jgi:hypothetical protein
MSEARLDFSLQGRLPLGGPREKLVVPGYGPLCSTSLGDAYVFDKTAANDIYTEMV